MWLFCNGHLCLEIEGIREGAQRRLGGIVLRMTWKVMDVHSGNKWRTYKSIGTGKWMMQQPTVCCCFTVVLFTLCSVTTNTGFWFLFNWPRWSHMSAGLGESACQVPRWSCMSKSLPRKNLGGLLLIFDSGQIVKSEQGECLPPLSPPLSFSLPLPSPPFPPSLPKFHPSP